MKKKNRIGTVFIYLIFIVLCLAILYPFLCVLSVSLSSAEDIKHYGFRVIPKHLDFSAYSYLFRDSKMLWQAYGTTIFVSVVGTAIGCLVTSLYAYAISRTTFRWRGVLSLFVTFSLCRRLHQRALLRPPHAAGRHPLPRQGVCACARRLPQDDIRR